ncbi:prolyl-tRNA synthetase [Aspergillus luchuensis]|uniref:Prolyl-tRNA synthetase n=1 Tax=Aspergillus kawachii TaxID=1069201 RepID=A0A146FT41_ASPKA|nr:prolyl-tRNA synthetase [Aspergillus luchuensis]
MAHGELHGSIWPPRVFSRQACDPRRFFRAKGAKQLREEIHGLKRKGT